MDDMRKTKEQLVQELKVMRERILLLERSQEGKEDTEKALRESEEKFRNMAEKSVVGIYLIQDGAFRYVNPRIADIFGYTVKELTAAGDVEASAVRKGLVIPQHVVLPEDWPMVRENIRKRIVGETESIYSQFRVITKKGEIRDVEVFGSRTTFHGRSALIGTMVDITERKQAERLLREAEQKYRSIFENAVEGIFQSTPEGHIVGANPAQARMLGYDTPEELVALLTDIGRQLYVDPARREEFIGLLEKDGIAQGFECELYKKDGSKMWVSMNAYPVRDGHGKTAYCEGTLEDITDRKKAENDLRSLNEFNKAIIDNAPIAIFTLDRNGVFTSINAVMGSLSGLGPRAEEKLIGFNWLKNPYTIQCGLAGHIEKGLKGEAFQLWDFPFITYRGDRAIFMDFKGVPLKGRNGEVEGLLCIVEETTERVRIRARLMQEAKMSATGRLAAGIAHELNNPLGTLVAYSELACRSLESLVDCREKPMNLDKLRGYLEIIEEEAFRCKNVTSDILSLPQKEGLEITEIEIDWLLDNVLEAMNSNRLNVKVVREATPESPCVLGDASALRQVFVNLINNAVDALEGRQDPTIWIRTTLKGDRAVVEIEDNGTGIPDSIVDKIFEPFFTTKESKKGTGLGLSLCHDFVSDMGGTIKVDSRSGFGATFFIALPVYPLPGTRK